MKGGIFARREAKSWETISGTPCLLERWECKNIYGNVFITTSKSHWAIGLKVEKYTAYHLRFFKLHNWGHTIEGEGEMCNETWEGVKKTAYGAFTNVMQFVLPFVTIIFCYTAIIKKLGQRSAQRPGAPRLVSKNKIYMIYYTVYHVYFVDRILYLDCTDFQAKCNRSIYCKNCTNWELI